MIDKEPDLEKNKQLVCHHKVNNDKVSEVNLYMQYACKGYTKEVGILWNEHKIMGAKISTAGPVAPPHHTEYAYI